MLLEDKPDRSALGRRLVTRLAKQFAVDPDRSRLQPFQSGCEPQQSAFAATGWSQQAGYLPGTRNKRYVVENRLPVETVADAAKLKAHGDGRIRAF